MRSSTASGLRIALIYVIAAATWIFLSDWTLSAFVPELARQARLQTIKGWGFVLLSGAALSLFCRSQFARRDRLNLELQEERERIRLLIEGVTDHAIILLDPQGRVATWNSGAERILGWKSDEIVGRHFAAFHLPADVAEDRPGQVLAAAERENSYAEEGLRRRRDGSQFWANLRLTALRFPDGRLRGFAKIMRDVTARKEAEAALAASAAQYELLFAANPLPMLVYDLETLRIVAVNEAMIAHYGYSREEFLAMTIRDIRPPEDVPRLLESVEAVRQGRERTHIEGAGVWRHRRKDGSIIFVEITSAVVELQGRPAEIVLANDITARQRAETELQENRARLAAIIETAMDAIITVDAEQRIVLFNRAAEAMFRVEAASALGQPLDRLLPERHREEHRRHIARFAESGITQRRLGGMEGVTGRRWDGEEFPVEASISQVVTPMGRFFTVILRDITARRHAEAELADSRRRLQIAVETAHIGFWEWDLVAQRTFYSPEWKSILGLDTHPEADDPEEYWRRVHPEDQARARRAQEELLSGARPVVELEFRARHADGSYRDLRTNSVLLRDAQGRPARIVGTGLDLTPARDAERTVRRLSAHVLRLQDMERRRIARELHDTTAQNLAALNMNLARLGRAMAAEKSSHLRLVDDSIALADLCVQEIRTLSYLLHPPLLDEFGLGRAVHDYGAGFSERSGIRVEVETDPAIGRLPDEIELSLFRVLQESLGNVHRHSGGSQARVRLFRDDREIVLEVADNGRGISSAIAERLRKRGALGVGITGMAERLEQLGGRLDIDSTSAGTVVRARAPAPA